MQMIMKDLLIPGRFIVLAGGGAITTIDDLKGNRYLLGERKNPCANVGWQIVDMLIVLNRDNQHMTGIEGPPSRVDECKDIIILIDNILGGGIGSILPDGKAAKGAIVIVGGVVIHIMKGGARDLTPRSSFFNDGRPSQLCARR